MPLSDRFTRSTSDACSSIDRFLWMTPRPPCCAIAMASRDSVTVSIAALTSGTFSRICRVRFVLTSTSRGTTWECCGTKRTSSNVRAVARSAPMASSVLVFTSIYEVPLGASRRQSMTLLVLLPAAARARVVAPHLRLVAAHGLDDVVAADARRLLAACGWPWRRHWPRRRAHRPTEWRRSLFAGAAEDKRRTLSLRTARGDGLVAHHGPDSPQEADGLLVHALLHRLKELEALFLVFHQRIALAVSTQADAFFQMVEAVEVILPLRVDDLQHDVALDAVQDIGPDQPFLVFVRSHRLIPDRVADLVRRPIVEIRS